MDVFIVSLNETKNTSIRFHSADSFINAFGHGKNIALVKRFECVTLK